MSWQIVGEFYHGFVPVAFQNHDLGGEPLDHLTVVP